MGIGLVEVEAVTFVSDFRNESMASSLRSSHLLDISSHVMSCQIALQKKMGIYLHTDRFSTDIPTSQAKGVDENGVLQAGNYSKLSSTG